MINSSVSKVLVTGATGILGCHVVKALIRNNRSVRILVRSPEKLVDTFFNQCEIVKGDITDVDSLAGIAKGCAVIYHCAGMPEQWIEDRNKFFKINRDGTQNMVNLACKHQIAKFIYISTIDLFDSKGKLTFNEKSTKDPKNTSYIKSKFEADFIVEEAIKNGLPAVFIHPGAMYGPHCSSTHWFSKLIEDFKEKKIPLLPPGGLPMVYAPDVAEGCLLAEEKASIGERYILNESCISWRTICDTIHYQLDTQKKIYEMPVWLAISMAAVLEKISSITRKPPLLQKNLIKIFLNNAEPINIKAIRELDWKPTIFASGVSETIKWLYNQQHVSEVDTSDIFTTKAKGFV